MPNDRPFQCLKVPNGYDPVYKIHDGRTGQWSHQTYVGEKGFEQGKADAERLNDLWAKEKRLQASPA